MVFVTAEETVILNDLFLDTDAGHTAYWGEHKYNGPATSGGKIWAGVAGFPPLTIEVRILPYLCLFLVYYHTSASRRST